MKSNLLTYTERIIISLDDGFQVDAVTDIFKAFNKISHNTRLKKL